jgi:hypothetical protein
MDTIIRIKDKPEAKSLLEHLKTLKYVEVVRQDEYFSKSELLKTVKAAEKTKSIPFEEAKLWKKPSRKKYL